MVILFLIDTAWTITTLTVKGVYFACRYAVYGRQETAEEKLERLSKEYELLIHKLKDNDVIKNVE